MTWMLPLGQVFGIRIRAHFSWLFIFLLVAWSLAVFYLPQNYPGWSTATYWGLGVAGSALLFASVLVHELSHSLMAMSRGHRVTSITLFFLGGVSEIEEESATAGEEFWISVVGPVTSLVLAAVFGVLFLLTAPASIQLEALTGYLALVNVALALFNMVPAFPLDGGRVLKSVVWRATGSLTRANNVATTVGSLLGFGLIGLGIVIAIGGNFIGGLWMVFIGWFIQSAASDSRQQYGVRRALSGRTVRDAMQEHLPSVEPGVTVQTLVDEYITRDFQRAYVVSLGDSFRGLVTISDVKRVPPEERPSKYVTEIMSQTAQVVTVTPDTPLEEALRQLASNDFNQLVVVDNHQPIGLLNRGDVLRVLEIANVFQGDQAT